MNTMKWVFVYNMPLITLGDIKSRVNFFCRNWGDIMGKLAAGSYIDTTKVIYYLLFF